MPRLRESVPKYRKHRASKQAVVTINGRDHYLGPHGTKAGRIEYDRRITEWLSSGRSSSFGVPEHVATITELVVDYVEYVRGHYGTGRNSELYRVTRVLRPLRELYGRTAAAEFGVLQFKALRQKFIDEKLARSFINASMRRITRMFKWAATEARISPIIPQSLAMVPGLKRGKTAARETEPIKPVDDKLVDATLPYSAATRRYVAPRDDGKTHSRFGRPLCFAGGVTLLSIPSHDSPSKNGLIGLVAYSVLC